MTDTCVYEAMGMYTVSLTSSLSVLVKMVIRSSDALLLPSSGLLLLGGGGALPSTLRVALSPLVPPTDPTLSFRTGLVSHFFSVLTERRDPGEFGAELPDA